MSDDPYVYAGTDVLGNRFGIRDAALLDYHEREQVAQRMSEPIPGGVFDLKHLRAIHRHLFQDIYDWAGEIRTVEIAKGGSQFQFRRYIETGMADVHRRIVAAGWFAASTPNDFAAAAALILGDVNYVHPFREGNGRTQLLYLKQLAARAGHRLDLTRIGRDALMDASRRGHLADYQPMTRCIAAALVASRGD